MKGRTGMRRFCVMTLLSCAAVTGGCFLLVPQIRYDLTASVAGVVGKADIRDAFGDYYADRPDSFWNVRNRHRRLLRVRLSTSRDLVAFANSKGVLIGVQWYFCAKPEQDVYLGGQWAFVDGERVPSLPRRPSPVIADGLGRFGYDAVLYVRGWFISDETGEIEGNFDLEREPKDVCTRVLLFTKMGGYKTNVARISKEEIAAALGVEISSESPRNDRGEVRQ